MANKLKTASSRAALVGNSYASLGVGDIVTTDRYNTENGIGGGRYMKFSGAPPAGMEANLAYVQMSDGWLKLIPNHDGVTIEQLSGLADFNPANPSAGRDNSVALAHALAFRSANNLTAGFIPFAPYPIRYGYGRYGHLATSPMLVRVPVGIIGAGVGPDITGGGFLTQLWFPNTLGSGLVFMSANTGPGEDDGPSGPGSYMGAGGSYIDGFSVHGSWDSVTPLDLNNSAKVYTAAIRSRTTIRIGCIGVYGWKTNGVHIHATAGAGAVYPYEGNANNCEIGTVFIHSCAGHGFWVAGMDVNGSKAGLVVTHVCGGVGLFASAGIGMRIDVCQITGYGNLGVARQVSPGLWRQFQYLGGAPGGNPAAVTPGDPNTDHIWSYIRDSGANAGFLDWDAPGIDLNQFKLLKCPIFISDVYTSIGLAYVEGGNLRSFTNSSHINGGNAGWTRSSATMKGLSIGANFGGMTGAAHDRFGDAVVVGYGGPVSDDYGNGIELIKWSDGGGPRGNFNYYGTEVSLNIGSQNLLEFTTPTTTRKFGGNAPQPYRTVITGLCMRSSQPPYDVRKFDICNGAPAGPALRGEFVAGEDYRDINARSGQYAIYRCTVSGVFADGPWAPGTYGGGDIVSTTDGRYYRNEAFHASTIKPTHTSTSGPVDPGDGSSWTYLGNSAPVFNGWGMIAS
jgi:hypothetical protein